MIDRSRQGGACGRSSGTGITPQPDWSRDISACSSFVRFRWLYRDDRVEAVSNGVMAFREPTAQARCLTLTIIIAILMVMLVARLSPDLWVAGDAA